jgi:hypothetical protein
MRTIGLEVCCFLITSQQSFAASPEADPVTVNYRADSGVPLRVYLTARLTKRLNQPVRAR